MGRRTKIPGVYAQEKRIGVYSIRCSITGMIYYGHSSDVYNRVCNHKARLRNGSHPNPALLADFRKYGEASFEFKILEYCDSKKSAVELEEYLIGLSKQEENSYNVQYLDLNLDFEDSELPMHTFVTMTEVSDLLRLAKGTLPGLVLSKGFPLPFRFGDREFFFDRQEILDWVKGQRVRISEFNYSRGRQAMEQSK